MKPAVSIQLTNLFCAVAGLEPAIYPTYNGVQIGGLCGFAIFKQHCKTKNYYTLYIF